MSSCRPTGLRSYPHHPLYPSPHRHNHHNHHNHQVVGLVDLNYELLVTSAQQGGITKRRVRLEGVLRSNSNVRDRRKEGLGGAMPPSFGMPGLASSVSAGLVGSWIGLDVDRNTQVNAIWWLGWVAERSTGLCSCCSETLDGDSTPWGFYPLGILPPLFSS